MKTPEQQGTQGLHRIREHHKAERTAAINTVRGLLREFGFAIPMGAAKVRPHAQRGEGASVASITAPPRHSSPS